MSERESEVGWFVRMPGERLDTTVASGRHATRQPAEEIARDVGDGAYVVRITFTVEPEEGTT